MLAMTATLREIKMTKDEHINSVLAEVAAINAAAKEYTEEEETEPLLELPKSDLRTVVEDIYSVNVLEIPGILSYLEKMDSAAHLKFLRAMLIYKLSNVPSLQDLSPMEISEALREFITDPGIISATISLIKSKGD